MVTKEVLKIKYYCKTEQLSGSLYPLFESRKNVTPQQIADHEKSILVDFTYES